MCSVCRLLESYESTKSFSCVLFSMKLTISDDKTLYPADIVVYASI